MEIKVKSYNYKLPDVNIVSSFHLHMHLWLKLELAEPKAEKSPSVFAIGGFRL